MCLSVTLTDMHVLHKHRLREIMDATLYHLGLEISELFSNPAFDLYLKAIRLQISVPKQNIETKATHISRAVHIWNTHKFS